MFATEIDENVASGEWNKKQQKREQSEFENFLSCKAEEYCETTDLLDKNMKVYHLNSGFRSI
jgi:hypothetical protein